ncbi:MAG TPA: hypothetical protein VMF91_03950 [Bryobacteraceae bacterium]|nr:hypothetical protein [Bryobacteraceae bacterium]
MPHNRADGKGQFYSRASRDGSLQEYFVDVDGQPTTTYPHVHVVINGDTVTVRASVKKGFGWIVAKLRAPSGQMVEQQIARARRNLRGVFYFIRGEYGKEVGYVEFVPFDDKWICRSIVYEGVSRSSFSYTQNNGDPITVVLDATYIELPHGGKYDSGDLG